MMSALRARHPLTIAHDYWIYRGWQWRTNLMACNFEMDANPGA
jgi:hypothetical protein